MQLEIQAIKAPNMIRIRRLSHVSCQAMCCTFCSVCGGIFVDGFLRINKGRSLVGYMLVTSKTFLQAIDRGSCVAIQKLACDDR